MGGGSPSPSPAGSPRRRGIEGFLTNALNNCRIQPADPGSSAAVPPAAAMPTCFAGFPPFTGSPCQHHHHKHKLKCHLKMIKHMRHHGPPKIKHRHHEHIKIKHRHHMHMRGLDEDNHRFPHYHPINGEEHPGFVFHHQRLHHSHRHHHGGPPHGHQKRQRSHGQCCSNGYHHFFTAPMVGTVPAPPQV